MAYGYGGVDTPVAATKESGGTLNAAGGCQFSFASPASAAWVQNMSTSPASLFVAVNSDEADDADNKFDIELPPGDVWPIVERRMRVLKFSIYAIQDLTYGTHFIVKGFVDGT